MQLLQPTPVELLRAAGRDRHASDDLDGLCRQHGLARVVGADEAGRGALAGELVAAAVLLTPDTAGQLPDDVVDSKQLTAERRTELAAMLRQLVPHRVVAVSAADVDAHGVQHANLTALRQAVTQLVEAHVADVALIDGFAVKTPAGLPSVQAVGGDGRSTAVAAASILAKVRHDQLLAAHARRWPKYGFDVHQGYGTNAHQEAILQHGLCDVHRRTFCRKLTDGQRADSQLPL